MTLGKVGAVTVICGVLAVQLFAISPEGRGGWYWPFVDYPMYSDAKQPGATFGLFDLEAIGCDGAVRPVSASDARLPPFRFRNAVALAAGTIPQRPDRPRDQVEVEARRRQLVDIVRSEIPGDWCELRVHGRIFRMNEHGLEATDVPRQPLAAWPVRGGVR